MGRPRIRPTRKECLARGLCQICRVRPSQQGRKSCDPCNDKSNARNAQNRELHKERYGGKYAEYRRRHVEKQKAADPQAWEESQATSRMKRRLRRYGVTPEQAGDCLDAQGGVCALCMGDGPLELDHDHATGLFRGWLCGPCNRFLGHSHDDTSLLRRAIAYLSGKPE